MVNISASFWQNKKILITGHSGFKGSWLSVYLDHLGAKVFGISLKPKTDPNMFLACDLEKKIKTEYLDIRDLSRLQTKFSNFQPEIVFHLAAQALVGQSYQDPIETYSTNILGTTHVLEACRKTPSVKVIVNVTTDKCYENKETNIAFQETDVLGGYDPYSSSKACSELISAAYRQSYFTDKIALATARAGNIIGGGDWTETRLIPDFIQAVQNNTTLSLRHPQAIRPWQHVLEPISGYLLLAENLWLNSKKFSMAWNFGPEESSCVSVEQVVRSLIKYWGRGSFSNLPADFHETKVLKLDSTKAKTMLGWKPRWSLNKALEMSLDWYQSFYRNEDVYSTTLKQIENYGKSV